MGLEVASSITEKIPLNFIVFSFVSGFILLFFSPIRYIFSLPSWLIDPFSMKFASDVLGSFLAIFICSLCLGAFMSLFRPFILIRLNGWLGQGLRLSRQSEEKDLVGYFGSRQFEFWKWVKENYVTSSCEPLMVQEALVTSLIMASEILILPNILLFILLIVISFSIGVWLIPPWIIFPIFLVYYRYYFRNRNTREWNGIRCGFIAYLNREKGEEGCFVKKAEKQCPIVDRNCPLGQDTDKKLHCASI